MLGLVGENGSGKSTTMNILGGVHQPDRGTMTIDGAALCAARAARRRGARHRVHPSGAQPLQEPDHRGEPVHRRVPASWSRACRSSTAARCASGRSELLAAIDLDLAPSTPVGRLSQGERQLVEIAKALGADARIVIFDEPTTSLTARETERLFAQIDRLRAQGHRDHLHQPHPGRRDAPVRPHHRAARRPCGRQCAAAAEMTIDRLITAMVGRTIDQIYPPREPAARPGTPVLEVRGLTQPGVVKDIALQRAAGRGRRHLRA